MRWESVVALALRWPSYFVGLVCGIVARAWYEGRRTGEEVEREIFERGTYIDGHE